MSFLSTAVRGVLEEGSFCSVAAATPAGPHCTPLVFAFSGGRVWLTTSRGSVKARSWRASPLMAGLVRHGDLAVSFTGRVATYDVLDTGTWAASVVGAPAIARASLRFSKKNARFFAGYAVDARQVPFAWTPPGRVFAAIDVERTALVGERGVAEGGGRWGGSFASHPTFRKRTTGDDPIEAVPADIAAALGREGAGALCVSGARGPVVVPTRWRAEEAALYVALPEDTLELTEAGPDAEVALTIDRPSAWRARDMVGAMVQGIGSLYGLDRLGQGSRSARSIARAIDPEAGALVRIAPRRLVWWKGWTSGSTEVG